MIKQIKKDITTVDKGIVAHGVNCRGVMGSGVALAIKTKWPIIYEQYKSMPTGEDMLGFTHVVTIERDTLFVANCYTQVDYGRQGRFADLEAINKCLRYIVAMAKIYELPVYIPQIGCGLGGLDWKTEVLPIVEEISTSELTEYGDVDIYVCVLEE